MREITVGSHNIDLHQRVDFLDLLHQFQTVHLPHHDICNHNVEKAPLQHVQRFFCIPCCRDVVTLFGNRLLKN